MSTLSEIKKQIFGDENYKLGVNYSTKLVEVDGEMVEQEDRGWLRHWNDEKRIAVSIPSDLGKRIREATDLSLQVEQRVGAKGAFTAYRIVGQRQPIEEF